MQYTQCPVCGKYTISEPGNYEICPICGWEDAIFEAVNPTVSGGANRDDLIHARIRFREEGRACPDYTPKSNTDLKLPKSGRKYPFGEYYYDSRNDFFLEKCSEHVRVEGWRYGSLDKDMDEIFEIKSQSGLYKQLYRDILDIQPKDDERHLPFKVLSEPGVVRLNFAGYVKKISTMHFKDSVLLLHEGEIRWLEKICGMSLDEILETDDEGCEKIYSELEERSPELAEKISDSIYELIWTVPGWMADWG